MKGMLKAVKRTPHMMGSKVGMSKKSNDPEFDEYVRKFAAIEGATDKLLKDAKVFCENVMALLSAGTGFATHFAAILSPLAGEFDLVGKHPDAALALRSVDGYSGAMEELRATLGPELELIESRVVGPVKEFQGVLKALRKSITKRDHKLVDYDRFNNSLTKLRDKKDKTLNDEKNLFRLEQDFEVAANDYDFWNNTMKTEMPQFMQLATQYIDPLFHSFFYMQLNIFYLMMEKLQGFSDGKVDISVTGQQISDAYEEKHAETEERVAALNIVHRIVSTSRMMTANRQTQAGGATGVGRAPSMASTATSGSGRSGPPSRASTMGAGALGKKAPPPPPGGTGAPPPYSPGNGAGGLAAATKRAPPPPPGLKPKPAPPPPKYVVALYDFAAQADGDLDFKAGDRIELVERTTSSEDWWTGKLNGRQGVFPGNYVQET